MKRAAGNTGTVARGIIFAALGGACWGFSGTCTQLLASGYGIPVLWIICFRLPLAAVILLAMCFAKEKENLFGLLHDRASCIRLIAFALLGLLLTQISYLSCIAYTNAGTGTVLERLGLLFILGHACVVTRRFPHVREIIGLLLALAGVFFIATKGDVHTLAIPPIALFWGIVSAISLAFYTVLPVELLKRWGNLAVVSLSMTFSGIVAVCCVRPWTMNISPSVPAFVVLVAMVIVGTVGAYIFYLQGIKDAGPVRAGLVGCIEPVSATIISAVWLHTQVYAADILGMVLIIGMVVLVTQKEEQPETNVPAATAVAATTATATATATAPASAHSGS